ncbi:MAG: nucleotide exchange factor GrpE [Patescibacteria group bacterium]
MTRETNNLYQCKECGFHYREKEMAEKCEMWCKEHKTCNVGIIKHAEENQPHQRDPASLVSEIEASELEKKCQEYLNNWKRAQADFENYKKDEAERAGYLIKYAKEDIILNILPILDSIDLAKKQMPGDIKNKGWSEGFLQIQTQIKDFLRREGIVQIETIGQPFDPQTMEVVEEVAVDGEEPGIVIEELQKGYKMLLRARRLEGIEANHTSKVIRPARVKISK